MTEDAALAQAVATGSLTLEKLEAMTSVCSLGLDMVPVPGDTDAETLAALIADELAIGVFNQKTTATRLIPVPGKKAGDTVSFGGLFGGGTILPITPRRPKRPLHPPRRPHPRPPPEPAELTPARRARINRNRRGGHRGAACA